MIPVAPRAGAWIETYYPSNQEEAEESLPVRERGLKPNSEQVYKAAEASLPVRERGLKHLLH